MTEISRRPRRSVLYMPASNSRALNKARSLSADALIFDLEDAVAPDAKEVARDNLLSALKQDYAYREVIVRVNGASTSWGRDDLQAIAQENIDAVLLPKVESAADIDQAVQLLKDAGASDHLPVWAMIETPLGVLNAQQIAAHERIQVLVMGTNDLSKELRVPQTEDRAGFITSLGMTVLAARAYGKEVIDGVYIDLNNEAGFYAACQQGKTLGFDGKSLIHPKQLAVANEVFSPSEQEIEQAKIIIDAWRIAEQQGKGVVLVEGKLVEELHVIEAQRLVGMSSLIDKLA